MQFYTVRRGDSLWRIASLIYHDGNRWLDIAEANRIRPPHRLTIGQRLILPNGSSQSPDPSPTPPQPAPPRPAPPVAPADPLDRIAPAIAAKARSLIEACRREGVIIRVDQALRTWDEQAALYAMGRTAPGPIRTNAQAGESFHNFGLAFDIVLLDRGRVTWDARHRGWRVAGEIGTGLGLLWGGNWKSIKDLPHFEMRGQLTLRDCQSLYAGGLQAVWDRVM
jgi:hypothetical protein